jgi:ribonuclease P protein component
MPDVRLRKEERLKSRKHLSILFTDGRSVPAFPLRIIWIMADRQGAYPVRAAFSVSRKRWKRAVDRNLFKRRMREAYRLQKHVLYEQAAIPPDKEIHIACLYTADINCPFEQIQTSMQKGLTKLAAQIHNLST